MILAMCAMIFLTMGVGILTFASRVNSVKKGEMNYKYFLLMEGYDIPKKIKQIGRNFNNQFEIPVLFYVAVLTHVVLNIENTFAIIVSWAFVFSRFLHAYIHITTNNLKHRVNAFWLGVISVFILWVHILIRQFF